MHQSLLQNLAAAAHADALGWLAAALMVATFACREARRMRLLAVVTNLAFFSYGAAAGLLPVLTLHALLLPINLLRWTQCVAPARGVSVCPRRPRSYGGAGRGSIGMSTDRGAADAQVRTECEGVADGDGVLRHRRLRRRRRRR